MPVYVGERNARMNLMAVLLGQVPAVGEEEPGEDGGGEDRTVVTRTGKKKPAREYCYAVRAVDESDRVTRTHDQMNQRCGGGRRVIRKKPGN